MTISRTLTRRFPRRKSLYLTALTLLFITNSGFAQSTEEPSHSAPAAVKLTDIFPLTKGRYVDYDAYTTDTLGNTYPSTLNHASYTIFATGVPFAGKSGAIDVRDSSGVSNGSTPTVSDIHYLPTAAGDIQTFADEAFMSTIIPPAYATQITPPDVYVDYLKLSAGLNKSYPVTTVTQDVTQSGISATVTAKVTGVYLGTEPVTVPLGTYDTAYKFEIKAAVQITEVIIPLGSFTITQQIWIVKGIGIVKSNLPSTQNSLVSFPGAEREMTAYGTRAVSAVALQSSKSAEVYPNPANATLTIQDASDGGRAEIYSIAGERVKSVLVPGGAHDCQISTADLPNGSYVLRWIAMDGTVSTSRVIVQH